MANSVTEENKKQTMFLKATVIQTKPNEINLTLRWPGG